MTLRTSDSGLLVLRTIPLLKGMHLVKTALNGSYPDWDKPFINGGDSDCSCPRSPIQKGMTMNSRLLSNKIWITRKTRICTEKRLLRNASWAQAFMIYYSCILVILSIWNLVYPSDQTELFAVFYSVIVLISSIYLSSQQFKERSLSMKNCYIKLDELCSKAQKAEKEGDDKLLSSIESDYSNILLSVENHSDYDYLSFRFTSRNDPDSTLPKFELIDYIDYLWLKGIRLGLAGLLIFVPLLVFAFHRFFLC